MTRCIKYNLNSQRCTYICLYIILASIIKLNSLNHHLASNRDHFLTEHTIYKHDQYDKIFSQKQQEEYYDCFPEVEMEFQYHILNR